MLWPAIFLISILQGLFLISLVIYKKSSNYLASRLLTGLLLLMVIVNAVYFVIRTEIHYYLPQLYGVSVGFVFLYGPLFYFYSRSVVDVSFQWKKKYWLHFVPYLIQLLVNSPMYLHPRANWIWYIDTYMAGNLPVLPKEKVLLALQAIHLLLYVIATLRSIRLNRLSQKNVNYIIPLPERVKWVSSLAACYILLFITVSGLYIFVLAIEHYNPLTNYINTLVTAGVIYFIAYKLVLTPDIINPGFKEKYQAYMGFKGEEGEKYIRNLELLMEEKKIFTNPDLKLSHLSEQLCLPPHQVSKLINEKFGKTFTEYINEFRVKEFQQKINDPKYQAFSIYSIALDVGFNSKSAFNTCFKKLTGKTPSEFKASPAT